MDSPGPAVERILAINPGSTSTKVALYEGETEVFSETVEHPRDELAAFPTVMAQYRYRRAAVDALLAKYGVADLPLAAVAGRGGLLPPMPGGAWRITPAMLETLEQARYGEHPCNLGAPLAHDYAARWGVAAYIVDPPVTDEMDEVARISGLPALPRRSVFHALSQRSAARRAATLLGVDYAANRWLVAHMGGGISVAAHRCGRIVDVINALDGDGPIAPERTGRLPSLGVLSLVQDGTYTFEQLRRIILREGGMWAHCGTNDLRVLERRMDGAAGDGEDGGGGAAPDAHAALVFEAVAYTIAKEIASLAPALMDGGSGTGCGEPVNVNACPARIAGVVLTGGMARSVRLTERLRRRLEWLAPVVVLPEVEEMHALASGVLRVLRGQETPGDYA
ncbi:butyrate kinase [Nitratidesulfovibrio sp. 1201_IL3209]|uniref:butyrate kinase n=1 Tax=Nitratidesulfovibrio sp. 1201_IL3209 TaxID=3084053 RepID=UPI002FD8C548